MKPVPRGEPEFFGQICCQVLSGVLFVCAPAAHAKSPLLVGLKMEFRPQCCVLNSNMLFLDRIC